MNEIGDSGQAADRERRRERGIAAYARIFNLPQDRVPAAMTSRVGPVYADEAFLAAGGPAWFHPAITDRERSMVIIAALAALGAAGERLDSHIQLAQRCGLDYDALTAMMTLVTNYVGQARGSQAMESIQRIAGQATPASATVPDNEVTP
ncbi:MAG TPA: carboxymuconolactone decarboxylase family protein [Streptosporangiaceae bacterium]|nr:carboxymuconolactone decarboxylase family protein [Streptosporangiaceae bacterium]